MPKLVRISDQRRQWLHQNHDKLTFTELARRLGCCVDTLKRILVREGLRDFDAAKYQLSNTRRTRSWKRPCIACKCTKSRPKGWYFCRACRRDRGFEDY